MHYEALPTVFREYQQLILHISLDTPECPVAPEKHTVHEPDTSTASSSVGTPRSYRNASSPLGDAEDGDTTCLTIYENEDERVQKPSKVSKSIASCEHRPCTYLLLQIKRRDSLADQRRKRFAAPHSSSLRRSLPKRRLAFTPTCHPRHLAS